MKENINKNEDVAVEREYFFPAHGVTVKATSHEEAEKIVSEKLKATISTNK